MRAAGCRRRSPKLQRALTGWMRPHHRFMLAELLAMIDLLPLAHARAEEEQV